MTRKPKAPPEAFTSDETFHYLLTELELVIASGTFRWTADSAIAARHRLLKVADMIDPLATPLENGR
jgi:hypothetical protein